MPGYPGQNALWTPEHTDALKKYHAANFSFAQIAVRLNEDFGTGYTRNAAIGRAGRIGLVSAKKAKAPPKYKKRNPSLRLVDGNGNSNHKRIIETSYSDQPELRCVEIIPLHLSLADLERNGCRYPYGDGPFTFCGHPKQDSTSYCPAHFDLTRGRQQAPLSDGARQLRRQRYADTQRKRILQASA